MYASLLEYTSILHVNGSQIDYLQVHRKGRGNSNFAVLFKEEIASSIHKTLARNKKVVFVILKFPKFLERKIHILWKIYDYNYINVDIK